MRSTVAVCAGKFAWSRLSGRSGAADGCHSRIRAPRAGQLVRDTALADTALSDTALADTALSDTALAGTALAGTALAGTALAGAR
jgi:hypothetical protein